MPVRPSSPGVPRDSSQVGTVRNWQLGFIATALLFAGMVGAAPDTLSSKYMDEPPPTVVTNIFAPIQVPTSTASWLDTIHESVFYEAMRNARLVNALLLAHGMDDLRMTGSYFRVSLSVQAEGADKAELSIRPDLDADIRFPGLDEKWRIFIDTISPGELPGRGLDEDVDTYSGIRRILNSPLPFDISTSAGIKWHWPPDPFVAVKMGRTFELDPWRIVPEQRFFWIESEGFGTVSSLRLDLWLMERMIARSRSAATLSESSEGWEWEQTLSLTYILAGEVHAPAHAIGIQVDAFGHYEHDEGQADLYRLTGRYRFPLYSDWLFVRLAGGAELRNEEDWETVPFVRFGFDATFGRN
jgi:hypothetical protein